MEDCVCERVEQPFLSGVFPVREAELDQDVGMGIQLGVDRDVFGFRLELARARAFDVYFLVSADSLDQLGDFFGVVRGLGGNLLQKIECFASEVDVGKPSAPSHQLAFLDHSDDDFAGRRGSVGERAALDGLLDEFLDRGVLGLELSFWNRRGFESRLKQYQQLSQQQRFHRPLEVGRQHEPLLLAMIHDALHVRGDALSRLFREDVVQNFGRLALGRGEDVVH